VSRLEGDIVLAQCIGQPGDGIDLIVQQVPESRCVNPNGLSRCHTR
jgi:hypothetical protein